MDIRILGSFEALIDAAPIDLGPRKQRALLAILALHTGEVVATERLIELIWGDQTPRTAAHSIQIYVSDLRRILQDGSAEPVIETRPPGYRLTVEPGAIDAFRFEQLVAAGTDALRRDDFEEAAEMLRGALGHWRGPPLAEFRYDEFAQPHIRRLVEIHAQTVEALAEAELGRGEGSAVIPLLEQLIDTDPLRERARELLMRALYRGGQPTRALQVYQDYRRLLGDELGLEPSPGLRELEGQILLHNPSLGAAAPADEVRIRRDIRNPFKGLRSFKEDDASDFFGRETLVTEMLTALDLDRRLLAVVGPSGSGKSSVIKAGLIPAIRAGRVPGSEPWLVIEFTPGRHPVENLMAAVAPFSENKGEDVGPIDPPEVVAAVRAATKHGQGEVLVVVDQFEELFTLSDDEERRRFLDVLLALIGGPSAVRIVLALRADFYDRPLSCPGFADLFADATINVTPLTAEEIQRAAVEPARQVNLAIEPALLGRLVADMMDRPGALPLFQYLLTELFEQRNTDVLSLDTYQQVGGLHGALSRRAESLYSQFTTSEREAVRQVMLRLVTITSHQRTSQRAALRELLDLGPDPEAFHRVIELLGRHRLLTLDRDPVAGDATVEVAHEALLREWSRLGRWIEEAREDLAQHSSLARATAEWIEAGQDPGYLLSGSRLAGFETWARETSLTLTSQERAFVEASTRLRDTQEAEETARRAREAHLARRARFRLWALAGSIAVVAALATFLVLSLRIEPPPDVVLVFEGRGDASWGDLLARGLDRGTAATGLSGAEVVEFQTNAPEEILQLAERGTPLIIAGGANSKLVVQQVAADYEDTTFAVIDQAGDLPNVTYLLFAEEEGSFLMGAVAALKTESGVIGFIGGVRQSGIADIEKFQAGYEAGARTVRPDITILVEYLTSPPDFSGFSSPTLGNLAAHRMYEADADVIYHAAGFSGAGVFDAAATLSQGSERHLWAIGVDDDQYYSIDGLKPQGWNTESWKPHVLTSMLKRVDVAVEVTIRDFAAGKLAAGVQVLDLASGGVDYSTSGGFIDDLVPELEALKQQIIDGQIEVSLQPET